LYRETILDEINRTITDWSEFEYFGFMAQDEPSNVDKGIINTTLDIFYNYRHNRLHALHGGHPKADQLFNDYCYANDHYTIIYPGHPQGVPTNCNHYKSMRSEHTHDPLPFYKRNRIMIDRCQLMLFFRPPRLERNSVLWHAINYTERARIPSWIIPSHDE